MLLISLMLAAAPMPAVKPDIRPRREVAPRRAVSSAARSKRLIELEATVRSLPLAAGRDEPETASGPQGL